MSSTSVTTSADLAVEDLGEVKPSRATRTAIDPAERAAAIAAELAASRTLIRQALDAGVDISTLPLSCFRVALLPAAERLIGPNADGSALDEDTVALMPAVHPLRAALFTAAGAQRIGTRTWRMPVGEGSNPSILAACLESIPAGHLWPAGSVAPGSMLSWSTRHDVSLRLRRLLGSTESTRRTLSMLDLADATRWTETEQFTDAPRAGSHVVLSVTGGVAYLKVVVEDSVSITDSHGLTHMLGLLPVGSKKDPLQYPISTGLDLVELLSLHGYDVLDATDAHTRSLTGGMANLRAITRNRVTGTAVPGEPGRSSIEVGASITVPRTTDLETLNRQLDSFTMAWAHPGEEAAVRAVKSSRFAQTDAPELATLLASAGGLDVLLTPMVADVQAMTSALPVHVEGLRPYQEQAVGIHMATTRGWCNLASPGLGKTVMTLAALAQKARKAAESAHGYRAAVVCPASIRTQWAGEAETWFPEAQVMVLRNGDQVREVAALLEEGTLTGTAGTKPLLIITSYELARRGEEMLCDLQLQDLVVDEAVVLRNPSSARGEALMNIRATCQVATALTGTPIDRNLDDLGRIVSFVRGESDLFHGVRLSHRFPDLINEDTRQRFRAALGPLVWRKDRSEIADELPEVSTEVILLDGAPAEIALANAARTELARIYAELDDKLSEAEALHPEDPRYAEAKAELASARGAALGGVTLARMACLDARAVAESTSAAAVLLRTTGLVDKALKAGSTKRTAVADMVTDLAGRGDRVLIFTDFASVAKAMVADLVARKVSTKLIAGGVSHAARDAAAVSFTEGSTSVLVLTGAGREGLNLQAANVIVHLDLPWTPSALVQRTGRAVRIGSRTGKVSVVIPILADTIEERVAAVLVPRAMTAMAALDSGRVDLSRTDLGVALAGLVDAVSESEVSVKESGMFALAREVLAG
jgi:superfamily II DNA or RNA helicase